MGLLMSLSTILDNKLDRHVNMTDVLGMYSMGLAIL